ncbi:hypothetical protein CCHR01_15226 [Colletotrichum chrysophilum]|uniref:Uncharacterized protein n=1 Tax=Colletotrichum chrysophilum TaxID=1836956 RepID=A0AAD9A6K3_9PEZI|nr:hypothetical protein CCHR01_15226 [Colletotrichum chrysophilum]
MCSAGEIGSELVFEFEGRCIRVSFHGQIHALAGGKLNYAIDALSAYNIAPTLERGFLLDHVSDILSETMRLEFFPLGVRVISLVTGAISADIVTGAFRVELFKDSSCRVKAGETFMARRKDVFNALLLDTLLQRLIEDMRRGAVGWRGH